MAEWQTQRTYGDSQSEVRSSLTSPTKIRLPLTVRVRVPFPAPFADVENWHIIRTQNAAFVGSTPTIGTNKLYQEENKANTWICGDWLELI